MSRDKQLYSIRKSAHQCVACGAKDKRTLSGMAYCAACTEKRKNAATARAMRTDPGKAHPSRAEYRAKMRAKRQAEGMCTSCGRYPAITGRKLCRKCRDENRIKTGRHRMKSVAGEIKACPYMDGLEDLGEYACLHCLRQDGCVYDREV